MSEITAPMSRSLLFRQSHYFEKLCTLLKMFKKSEFVLFTDCCCTDVLISAVGSLQGDVHLLPHGVDISTSARCLVSDTRCLVSDTRCLVILELRRWKGDGPSNFAWLCTCIVHFCVCTCIWSCVYAHFRTRRRLELSGVACQAVTTSTSHCLG